MRNPFITKCIDINTEFCPCLLAETNHCTFCSKLQGKADCDCNWPGVCIFYEKFWQDKRKAAQRPLRVAAVTTALRQEAVGNKTYRLSFCVDAELAARLAQPGAFVFLRRVSDPECSHFPVGVMRVDGDEITVVVEAIGAKSSRFILNQAEQIVVRGPYYNGVLGKPWLDGLKGGKVIIIAGGIGQAPALPILQALLKNENQVCFIAAPGQVGEIFIREAVAATATVFTTVASLRREGFVLLQKLLQQPQDLLVSAGPDAQHSGIIRFMNDIGVNLPMAATNNATMCCGEGLCGSCRQLTQGDKTVKMCKTQLNYREIMQE